MTEPREGSEWDQTYLELGYAWCRPCRVWHRPPECSTIAHAFAELARAWRELVAFAWAERWGFLVLAGPVWVAVAIIALVMLL